MEPRVAVLGHAIADVNLADKGFRRRKAVSGQKLGLSQAKTDGPRDFKRRRLRKTSTHSKGLGVSQGFKITFSK
eukprot:3252953-Pyramimonas_sp.AAC.1